MKTKSPGIAVAMSAYYPAEDHVYPVPQDLAHAIIEQAIGDEFDVAISATQRTGAKGPIGIGHAVGFIYRRILKDRPVPVVPILLNTYFPPNQPTPKRCYEFGRSIGRAVRSWNGTNENKRVAVCASGGISHFVIDEEFDHRMSPRSRTATPKLSLPSQTVCSGRALRRRRIGLRSLTYWPRPGSK